MIFDLPVKRAEIGLVLTGGGARAAYQAGVLAGVARLLPRGAPSPFRVICGTSAGALNAGLLAANAENFTRGVGRAMRAWSSICASSVHRTDARSVARTLSRWARAVVGGDCRGQPISLLDNAPLRELVTRLVDFNVVRRTIERGHLDALCVTASSYDSGGSVSFFEGVDGLKPWHRTRRSGVRATLGPQHLLASSAIPFIHPPELIEGEYYGDGSMQQFAPLSPAIQLGADKIFVIGVGPSATPRSRAQQAFPSFGQIGAHLIDSLFVDSLACDLERLRRINEALAALPPKLLRRGDMSWRPVQALVIAPRQSPEELAAAHAHRLPKTLRWLLRAIGASGDGGSAVLSFLLTEGGYCKGLMRQGFEDAMLRRDEIARFLGAPAEADRQRAGVARRTYRTALAAPSPALCLSRSSTRPAAVLSPELSGSAISSQA